MKLLFTGAAQLLTAGLVFFAFAYLYFSRRTGVHTFDALSYTNDVETKPIIELYHPHHLLYGMVGRLSFDLAKVLGYDGRADTPIQALNALAGAAGVILLWRFGARFTGRRWLPLSIALLVGVCYAYWRYAAEVEVYTFAALFISLSLWLLAHLEHQPTPALAILLGAAGAGAVMFHQTNLLFAVPIGMFLLMEQRRLLAPYGITFGVGVSVPYLLVGWFSGFRDVDSYYRWLTDYAQRGTWGGYLGFEHLPALRDGLLDTISLNPPLAWGFYGLVVVGLALGSGTLWRTRRSWLVFGGVWLVVFGAFFWWWEPWNIEFWIALLPLWAGMMLAGLKPHSPPSVYGERGWGIGVKKVFPTGYMLPCFALLLAGLLFRAHDAPIRAAADPQNDYYHQITLALQPFLAQTDLVVTRGNILDLYLPFYGSHPAVNVISLRDLTFGGGEVGQSLIGRLMPAYQRGQIIYIDQILLDEPQDSQRNPFGLTGETIASLKSSFPISETVRYNGRTVFYSIGIRSTPDALVWRFEDQLAGWLAFGAGSPRFEDGGWCFTGGGDPWLESPPLKLDAAAHPSLRVEIALRGEAEYGQVFWRRAAEGLDEVRSLRFALQAGRHSYPLNLAGRAGWQDEIVFLRLDPIPENLQATACVYGLWFEE